MSDQKIKLIAFDMDGTLTSEHSSWEYLHRRMEIWHEKAHVFQDLFWAGKIDYAEFCRLDASLWQGTDCLRAAEILTEIQLRPRAGKVLRTLHRSGVKIALLSSGLKLLADQLAQILPFHHHLANELVCRDGSFTGEVLIHVSTDVRGLRKEDHLQNLMDKYNIRPEEAAAVGDSLGDLEMLRATPNALLIGAKDEDKHKIMRELPKIILLQELEDIFRHLPFRV
ncbi:phosphoserine phosphatase-like hydrolase [Desulfofarcimen acetoxidans DSM 771]|uniref:phosphoserine phosphatase n=1 Tax=Desulfofarcimen acetoxidans (strain ATCC 49208 / DSM 771 / KCTC 5769 / VKM B-1644 / 5575) TaxID=485916 RepID=C8W270_DESAS|nr:HAD-IB family phosphatase [Desulfofarcimen acetoxidans]ACV61734.1 phosphoserine phosphatase-like hydrolase [Desulfofarcimen acetoxidans DSM 771]